MKIRARGVDSRRHTTGYLIGNRWRTRSEAVDLAYDGKLDDVVVRFGGNDGEYLASRPNSRINLYDLPVRVGGGRGVRRYAR